MNNSTFKFEDPRRVLKRHGLRPKKSFGQNFLVSEAAVRAICEATVGGGEVIEIGAGLGTLTSALLSMGAQVTAIERDREMCDVLRAELGDHPHFALEEADAASFDYAARTLEGPLTIVGNLPYQITGQILRRILDIETGVRKAVVMVQLEVAQRIIAPASDTQRGVLSVIAQSRATAKIIHRLNPTAFFPPPKVRSAVVELIPLEHPVCVGPLRVHHDRIVKAAFSSRRKTLRNALRSGGIGSADAVQQLLDRAGVSGDVRAETLTGAQFVDLAKALPH